MDEAIAALEENDEGPLLELLYKLQNAGSEVGAELAVLFDQASSVLQFQRARYDGVLAGTEVGMVLFYTDLLAKLWALDYAYSAPSQWVDDFTPLLTVPVASIYSEEMRVLSSTRLWFGPQRSSFQRTNDTLLLERTSTRVYAASSNPLKPGEEVEPNSRSARFLGWWNNHYSAVAEYEPQYQRLNEIMKWSLALSWLSETGGFAKLDFLEDAEVARTHWFPDWVRSTPGLRFRSWDRVSFYRRGFNNVSTEALPLLVSRTSATGRYLRGGVSLGTRDVIRQTRQVSLDTNPLFRRSGLKNVGRGRSPRFVETLDDVRYEFPTAELRARADVLVDPRPKAKLRTQNLEIKNEPVRVGFERQGRNLNVDVRVGEANVGRLDVRRTGRGFDIGFKSFELERANSVLRVLEESVDVNDDVLRALSRTRGVESAVDTPSGLFVKLNGRDSRWLKVSPEGEPTVNLSDGVSLRYAGLGEFEAPRWMASWVPEAEAATAARRGDYLVFIDRPLSGPSGTGMRVSNRGPPEGKLTNVELGFEGDIVQAKHDPANGLTYVENRALPPNVRDATLLDGPQWPGADRDAWGAIREIEEADYESAARRIARSPEEFKLRLEEYRQSALKDVDHLISEGSVDTAARRLDDALRTFESDPELLARRALVAIGSGKAGDGARFLESSLYRPLREPARFVEEVYKVLDTAGVPREARVSLEAAARGVDLNTRLPQVAGIRGEVAPLIGGDGLSLELRLLEWRANATSVRDATGAGKTTYVAVDPSVATRTPVTQVLSDNDIAYKLQSWEIVHARPEVITDSATGTRYVLADATRTSGGTAFKTRSHRVLDYRSLSSTGCDGTRDDGGAGDCPSEIYLVGGATPNSAIENVPSP